MWNSITLTPLEYKHLVKAIEEFTGDINKLTRLQYTGHFPLILASKNDLHYDVTVALHTLEVLGKIDHRFLNFREDATPATVNMEIIDKYDLLLGHKESFKKAIQKRLLEATN